MSTDFGDEQPTASDAEASDELDDLQDVAVPAETNPADWQEQQLVVEDPESDERR